MHGHQPKLQPVPYVCNIPPAPVHVPHDWQMVLPPLASLSSGEAPAAPRLEQDHRTAAGTSHPYGTGKIPQPTPSVPSAEHIPAEGRAEERVAQTRSSRSGYHPTGERSHHQTAPRSVQASLARFNVLPPRATAPKS
ncbi:hypothetical protein ONZ51_g4313 [Trametes cubensis]|uniref:Uncharacterized protein n=1 Tax=Trametes cubensis TaxID=1111947 RepID=A0AAD7TWL7_9APHY|nr:hypothetical protein ONZ51_g4313 [Trametes cubensis]